MPKLPSSDLLRSLLAATARGWRGTQLVRRAQEPTQLLIVFDRDHELQLDGVHACVDHHHYARPAKS